MFIFFAMEPRKAPWAKKDGANSGDNKKCTDVKYRHSIY